MIQLRLLRTLINHCVASSVTCALLITAGAACTPAWSVEPIRFNRDIRPILSAHCYHCHGPDENHRESDLRFDVEQSDLAEREVIVPGDESASELVQRILSKDPDLVMPPPEAKLELSPEAIELLRRWVREGGGFEGHWAFITPEVSSLPKISSDTPIRNEIDVLVQHKLAGMGLTAAPEADRRALIRRATFDLWGLPPTPHEIQAFLNDDRADAYERLIDRLLDSPRYAERMTLNWMDAARYGDTSVFHADGPRDMWPWRDWVLNAYATNMPFDQFTLEQLAGDLLPEPTTEQLVATGFNRNHGTTDEGGAIDEEYRVEYLVDRVKTTSMVWMGITMECAQCHDHKYDPITQDDYYRFYAFFNQTPEKGMQTRNGNAEPRVPVPADAQRAKLSSLEASLKEAESQLTAAVPPDELVNAWVTRRRAGGAQLTLGDWYQVGPFQGSGVDETFGKKFGPEREKKIDLQKKYAKLTWKPAPDWKDGQVINFAYSGAGDTTYLYRKIHATEPTELALSLGSDDTITVWLNRKQVLRNKAARGAAADQEKISVSLAAGDNDLLIKICNNSGPTGYYFKAGDDTLPEELQKAIELAAEDRSEKQTNAIVAHFKDRVWTEGKTLREVVAVAKKAKDDYQKSIPTVMVMQDMAKPRMTYVLNRGSYDSPNKDRPVEPATPSFLPQFPETDMQSRLGLAKWLTHPDHPLTARVAVNRYWTMLFGRGLVSTTADFGSQGAWPSHPELLDRLARDFADSGWNVKRMLRKIMTSHTYRQSSRVTKEHLAIDPLNEYLSRAPRMRLTAEAIRDNALSVAGLLVEEVGGPGVKPYQPPGLWNEVSLDGNVRFRRDNGENLYRRTMYTYWKRSSPQPAMMAFDVPTREKCVIQRQSTNTPLQALVTLNDEQFVEAARCFAQRVLEYKPETACDECRMSYAFELATGRSVDEERAQLLFELLEVERSNFHAEPDKAKGLLAVGEARRNESLDVAEHAAWTVVASVILNLDETLNKE